MKYGFFGGAFNPPTCAHLELAKQAKKIFNLDKVFFVPVGNLYKKDDLIDEKHRYEMLNRLCSKYEYLDVSDLEMNLKINLKAIDVFEIINEKYSKEIMQDDLEIYFIIGSDNLLKMEQWKSSQKLVEQYKYIVLERNEKDIENIFNKVELFRRNKSNFNILKRDNHDEVSSTKIREYFKQDEKEKACNMIPEEVYEYILENKLYE